MPVSIENDECVPAHFLSGGPDDAVDRLYDIMNFFSGDMDGNGGHDDAARIIASRGRRWAEQHWRVEDCQACTSALSHFLLPLRLARADCDYTAALARKTMLTCAQICDCCLSWIACFVRSSQVPLLRPCANGRTADDRLEKNYKS